MSIPFSSTVGVVARPGAKTTIVLDNLKSPVGAFGMSYLKSYGEKWEGSTARFTLKVFDGPNGDGTLLHEQVFDVLGFHNQTVSISYREDVSFLDHRAPIGGSLRLGMELIGGSTFKINSMTLCSK